MSLRGVRNERRGNLFVLSSYHEIATADSKRQHRNDLNCYSALACTEHVSVMRY